jgi:hypothetical protein
VALELKATRLPSALMATQLEKKLGVLSPFACAPALLTLTRSVTWVSRSWTKMSRRELVSPATRVVALEV